MLVAPYPPAEIRKQVPLRTWKRAISNWVTALKLSPDDSFIAAYLREQSRSTEDSRDSRDDSDNKLLRAEVFYSIINGKALQSPSPEQVRDFVIVYGPTNVTKTCSYILALPQSDAVIRKLSKLLLHSVQENDSNAITVASVLASNGTLIRKLASDEWLVMLDSIGSSQSMKMASLARAGLDSPDPADVASIVDMFPQVDRKKAADILKSVPSVDAAIAHLLEHADQIEQDNASTAKESKPQAKKTGPIAQFGKKEKKLDADETFNSRNKELIMKLAAEEQEYEDELDDTYEEAEAHTGDTPASAAALNAIEKYLWDYLNRLPDLFARTARKSKQRQEMKRRTEWTDEQIEGWARNIEKNPTVKRRLEDKYMFRGNNADPEEQELDLPEPSQPQPQSQAQTRPQSQQQQKSNPQRDRHRKEKNKARVGNHNRKSGHAKKMAKMNA
uniref:ARAD1D10406p n=1 Tax=Blastobotrys adeninivorans TaxID=409370 RepID=A0A060T8D3_BLAAD